MSMAPSLPITALKAGLYEIMGRTGSGRVKLNRVNLRTGEESVINVLPTAIHPNPLDNGFYRVTKPSHTETRIVGVNNSAGQSLDIVHDSQANTAFGEFIDNATGKKISGYASDGKLVSSRTDRVSRSQNRADAEALRLHLYQQWQTALNRNQVSTVHVREGSDASTASTNSTGSIIVSRMAAPPSSWHPGNPPIIPSTVRGATKSLLLPIETGNMTRRPSVWEGKAPSLKGKSSENPRFSTSSSWRGAWDSVSGSLRSASSLGRSLSQATSYVNYRNSTSSLPFARTLSSTASIKSAPNWRNSLSALWRDNRNSRFLIDSAPPSLHGTNEVSYPSVRSSSERASDLRSSADEPNYPYGGLSRKQGRDIGRSLTNLGSDIDLASSHGSLAVNTPSTSVPASRTGIWAGFRKAFGF